MRWERTVPLYPEPIQLLDPVKRDCVRRAQEDYRAAMAQLGGRH